jgi:uncharacterized membrane protein
VGTRAAASRAIAFSDAVFAIIITVLVLDLGVPNVPPGRLLSGLLEQWPSYVAYLASYTYVAIVWLNHKGAFNRVKESDRGLDWVNFFVLFTTALLPFPTAVVSHALQEHDQQDQRVAVAFYALIGALLCASWLAFFHYLARREDLLEEEVSDRALPRRAGAGIRRGHPLCRRRAHRVPGRTARRPGDLRRAAGVLRRHQRRSVPGASHPPDRASPPGIGG